MELADIQQLMKQLEESCLKKLVLKEGDFELLLEKESEHFLPPSHSHLPPHSSRGIAEIERFPKKASQEESFGNENYITSPLVGTFYASPVPDQPSFVKVGDRVDESTPVCIVESMKLMNEIPAGVNGVIREVLIDNGQPVEFGQAMFRVEID